MFHKVNMNAPIPIASLIVMSTFIFMSCFATPAILTYAQQHVPHSATTLALYRPTDSSVGAVIVENTTTGVKGNCIHTPNQGPNSLNPISGTFDTNDHIRVTEYAGGNCESLTNGIVPKSAFDGHLGKIKQPSGISCGTGCIVLQLLNMAVEHPITLKILRGATSGVGSVRVTNITRNNLSSCAITPTQVTPGLKKIPYVTVTSSIPFDSADRIDINTYADGNPGCTAGTGLVYSNGILSDLPECGNRCYYFQTS